MVYAFSGAGSGTEFDPYIITTVTQLQEMNNKLDAWYVLGNDIDASITSTWNGVLGFDPIGTFTGHFDGHGYIISNLYINRPLENQVGLFGQFGEVGLSADVQRVGLVDVDITGDSYVGGFAGQNRYGSTITCCYVTGSVSGDNKVGGFVGENNEDISNCYFKGSVSGNNNVGGFVGENFYGSISDCFSMGSVSGKTWIGGFAGQNWYDDSTITNCYATGSVSGDGEVGGFAGDNEYMITSCYATGNVSGNSDVGGFAGENSDVISNCYAMGNVSGDNRVGGFVGENNADSTITNCYATGSVSGNSNVGGFAGSNLDTITSCYWDKDTSGMATSDGGVGKTTAEMKKQATFTGWDFTNIWSIVEDVTYPDLIGMSDLENVCGWGVHAAPVGGISTPINKLEILTPYIALAGLIIAISTVYVIIKRKD
jgi:hypothetical protein